MAKYVPFKEEELVFLNNFFCHFRFGETAVMPDGAYRTMLAERWNVTMREWIKQKNEEKLSIYCNQNYSDMKLEQTPAEFYTGVDKTIVEVGLSVDLVAKTISAYLAEREIDHSVSIDPFLSPIYKELRLKGYNQFDLCA